MLRDVWLLEMYHMYSVGGMSVSSYDDVWKRADRHAAAMGRAVCDGLPCAMLA